MYDKKIHITLLKIPSFLGSVKKHSEIKISINFWFITKAVKC